MCDEDGRHGDLEDEVEGDVESPENSEPVVADTDSGDDVQDHHGSMDDL
nr:hypothetical protein [Deltaproteobacteria bacterium]